MENKIKKSMETCFEMQHIFWKTTFQSYPKVPYTNEFNNASMYIENSLDEEGYVQWQPCEQTGCINEDIIEKRLGIKLNVQLKEFYSAFCFLQLVGKMRDGIVIDFDKISFGRDITEQMIEKYIACEVVKQYLEQEKNYELFQLGIASVDENDGYTVCFDNQSGNVLLINFEDELVVDLNISLSELFNLFVEVY